MKNDSRKTLIFVVIIGACLLFTGGWFNFFADNVPSRVHSLYGRLEPFRGEFLVRDNVHRNIMEHLGRRPGGRERRAVDSAIGHLAVAEEDVPTELIGRWENDPPIFTWFTNSTGRIKYFVIEWIDMGVAFGKPEERFCLDPKILIRLKPGVHGFVFDRNTGYNDVKCFE